MLMMSFGGNLRRKNPKISLFYSTFNDNAVTVLPYNNDFGNAKIIYARIEEAIGAKRIGYGWVELDGYLRKGRSIEMVAIGTTG